MTDTRTPQISLTGYADSGGEMSSNIYKVVIDGTTYTVERWATRNACGEEWVTEDGKNVPSPLDDSDVFADVVNAFDTAFYLRWREQVQPLIDRITAEALAEAAAKQQEA